MVRLTVLYGHPEDPAAFLNHYENTHVPLAQAIPDVVRFTWGKCLPGLAGEDPPYFLVAELEWESPEAMSAAMTSEKGGETGADVANFATGGATMVVSEGS
ncbi:MAG: EthD family reductase [Acidimicrobiales bacterium]